MAFKKAFILGGAILLAAGCSSTVTSPIAEVHGGAAAAARAPKDAATAAPRLAMPASATADSSSCRGAYPVSSGFVDTACAIEQ